MIAADARVTKEIAQAVLSTVGTVFAGEETRVSRSATQTAVLATMCI